MDATKHEKQKLMEAALGRIFRMGSRPTQPGDIEEYERCRKIIMDLTGTVPGCRSAGLWYR